MTSTYPKVFVQLPLDPVYWGHDVDPDSVSTYCDRLQGYLVAEFADMMALEFERTATPRPTGVFADDEELVVLVYQWIQNNWTSVL